MKLPFICLIHGAGGGGWEYDYIWKQSFLEEGLLNFNAIELVPNNNMIESTRFEDYVNQIINFIQIGNQNHDDDVVLIGASMGGVLALKVAETIKSKAVVLVCSTVPLEVPKYISPVYPSVIMWANGKLQSTIDAMPDSDLATCEYASARWRNESGAVLNEIVAGVSCQKLNCPSLVIIPENDDTVPVESQRQLAVYLGSEIFSYVGMSHVGPLLSTNAAKVAKDVSQWIKGRLS